MAHEYVFRGEHKPFAPDPKDERAREAAKREAEQLVDQPSVRNETLPHDADVEERVGDYQVGGLDAFGANSKSPASDDHTTGGTDRHP